ncbi:MAG: winged helix-turn-helix domain-containing protein [Actinobacteria bacterium]|nr:MAG: winged helix-turn-helix domain-containing protein [Actinomycetota bacterium]
MRKLRRDQARRYALAAQGFNEDRPSGRIDVRHFRKVMRQVGIVQLDSVNVFARAHYMPFFSRIGPYDRESLDEWLWGSGEVFEYWGHEASLIPTEDHYLWRWRMKPAAWDRVRQIHEEYPGYIEAVLEQVEEFGPLQTSDLVDPGESSPGMWNWSKGKVALEALFMEGRVTAAARPNFVRLYDLVERVIAPEHLNSPELGKEEAFAELLLRAAGHLGVGTADDLIDYPRLNRNRGGVQMARDVIRGLVERGKLEEVEVEGWGKPAYVHPEATLPNKPRGTALLSPFDSLVWSRPRTERLWDFHYRIEIYVPEPQRVYGYYVLPFLLDGDLVARVDLKTGRRSRQLHVKGAFGEQDIDRKRVGRALTKELEAVASWLEMEELDVSDNGDLAPHIG